MYITWFVILKALQLSSAFNLQELFDKLQTDQGTKLMSLSSTNTSTTTATIQQNNSNSPNGQPSGPGQRQCSKTKESMGGTQTTIADATDQSPESAEQEETTPDFSTTEAPNAPSMSKEQPGANPNQGTELAESTTSSGQTSDGSDPNGDTPDINNTGSDIETGSSTTASETEDEDSNTSPGQDTNASTVSTTVTDSPDSETSSRDTTESTDTSESGQADTEQNGSDNKANDEESNEYDDTGASQSRNVQGIDDGPSQMQTDASTNQTNNGTSSVDTTRPGFQSSESEGIGANSTEQSNTDHNNNANQDDGSSMPNNDTIGETGSPAENSTYDSRSSRRRRSPDPQMEDVKIGSIEDDKRRQDNKDYLRQPTTYITPDRYGIKDMRTNLSNKNLEGQLNSGISPRLHQEAILFRRARDLLQTDLLDKVPLPINLNIKIGPKTRPHTIPEEDDQEPRLQYRLPRSASHLTDIKYTLHNNPLYQHYLAKTNSSSA